MSAIGRFINIIIGLFILVTVWPLLLPTLTANGVQAEALMTAFWAFLSSAVGIVTKVLVMITTKLNLAAAKF